MAFDRVHRGIHFDQLKLMKSMLCSLVLSVREDTCSPC